MRLMTIGSTPEVMILSHCLQSRQSYRNPKRRKLRFQRHLAALAYQCRGDDLVVFRHVEIAGLGVERKGKKVEHITRVERACVGGDTRGQIGEPDDLDPIFYNDLVELGAFDIAALLG